jgi:hypothetical protein
MIRTIRTVCTGNLLLAIAVVAGCILYGFAVGLPIDQDFLGGRRWRLGRGGGPMMPAWSFLAILEGLILVLFLCERYAGWERKTDRLFCGVFGLVAAIGFVGSHLPHRIIFPEDEKVFLIPLHDQMLLWYLWGSHVLYALMGSNDD